MLGLRLELNLAIIDHGPPRFLPLAVWDFFCIVNLFPSWYGVLFLDRALRYGLHDHQGYMVAAWLRLCGDEYRGIR
jgi:hypothetical protein